MEKYCEGRRKHWLGVCQVVMPRRFKNVAIGKKLTFFVSLMREIGHRKGAVLQVTATLGDELNNRLRGGEIQ